MADILTFAPRPRPALPPEPMQADMRAQIEAALEVALTTVDHLVAVLDQMDGNPDEEDGADAEPSLGAPEGHVAQLPWLRGTTRDLEIDRQPETRP